MSGTRVRTTHTTATIPGFANTYRDLEKALKAAGYEHAFDANGRIDLAGLAVDKPLTYGATTTFDVVFFNAAYKAYETGETVYISDGDGGEWGEVGDGDYDVSDILFAIGCDGLCKMVDNTRTGVISERWRR